jgi:hypothetical protein
MRKYAVIISTILFSCSVKEDGKKLSGQLIGEWRNVSMKVEMPTVNNTDSSSTLDVTEANWEQVMQIRTIQTFFNADGTYRSTHTNLNDSIIYNPAGKWAILGDSILMTDTFPQPGLTYTYRFTLREQNVNGKKELLAEFRGVEDFDQDGKKDDTYSGVQRKQ